MSIFKKITLTALSLGLVISLSACSSDDGASTGNTGSDTSVSDNKDSGEKVEGTEGEEGEEKGEKDTEGEEKGEGEEGEEAVAETGDVDIAEAVEAYAMELITIIGECEELIDVGNTASDLLMEDYGNDDARQVLTESLSAFDDCRKALNNLSVPSEISEVHKLFISDFLKVMDLYDEMMEIVLAVDTNDEEAAAAVVEQVEALVDDVDNAASAMDESLDMLLMAMTALI